MAMAYYVRFFIIPVGKGDYSKCDCIGIAILTHGKRYSDRVIFGCDEEELDLEKLLEPIKNCESLAGKPKFILVQVGKICVDVPGGHAGTETILNARKIPRSREVSICAKCIYTRQNSARITQIAAPAWSTIILLPPEIVILETDYLNIGLFLGTLFQWNRAKEMRSNSCVFLFEAVAPKYSCSGPLWDQVKKMATRM